MHWQFHGVFQKTLYTRKVADVTKLTDFTDLQTYGFVRLSQPRGPPAHARGLQHEALQEGGGSEMSVVAAQDCCINSFPRAHARGVAGAAGLVRFVAAARACGVVGARQERCTSSSRVPPVGRSGAGLRSCWEAGPRARAHAESRIDFGTKSAYFWRQSGCTAWIRKAWRWRGSAGSPACGSEESSVRSIAHSTFLTASGRLSKSSRSFYGLPAVGAAATRC